MLAREEIVRSVDFDSELETVVVRTNMPTNYEAKLQKKTRTSGCAVGTVFGDIMEGIEGLRLPPAQLKTSWLYSLSRQINQMPSLYLSAGAIHGTVLCLRDEPLVYMEAWDATMRWIRWPGGCGRRKPPAPIRSFIRPGA